ncbi:MAG TPA: carbohydrate ABC transporter permease [Streptosporangiaceae bacterium]|nr:carbohydrate ABC transporter permease [Streptosporangiaceae bacterium]
MSETVTTGQASFPGAASARAPARRGPGRRPPRRSRPAGRRRFSAGRAVAFLLATAWLVIVLAPIYYMVLASFRTQGGYLTANPWLPAGGLTAAQYGAVFAAGLGRYLLNSVIITACCIVLTLALSLGAAFRIVRTQTRAAGAAFRVLLFGLAIPVQAIMVPLYLLVYKMHLYDTLFALILVMSAAAIPVSVLIMTSFIRDIPRELISAMLVDGGTEWTVFRRLIVPLSRPVLATLAIYDGLNVWNNFLLPLILTQSPDVAVLPLGLYKFQGTYGINVPAVMAAVILSVLPLVALFIAMRRQVMNSLGAVAMR